MPLTPVSTEPNKKRSLMDCSEASCSSSGDTTNVSDNVKRIKHSSKNRNNKLQLEAKQQIEAKQQSAPQEVSQSQGDDQVITPRKLVEGIPISLLDSLVTKISNLECIIRDIHGVIKENSIIYQMIIDEIYQVVTLLNFEEFIKDAKPPITRHLFELYRNHQEIRSLINDILIGFIENNKDLFSDFLAEGNKKPSELLKCIHDIDPLSEKLDLSYLEQEVTKLFSNNLQCLSEKLEGYAKDMPMLADRNMDNITEEIRNFLEVIQLPEVKNNAIRLIEQFMTQETVMMFADSVKSLNEHFDKMKTDVEPSIDLPDIVELSI